MFICACIAFLDLQIGRCMALEIGGESDSIVKDGWLLVGLSWEYMNLSYRRRRLRLCL